MITDFLNVISDASECGEYLRYHQVYDDIREEKREDDSRLSQGVWKIELKKANWNKVTELCTDVLKNKSKDLQIAAWLAEAYTATRAWEGMYDGISLIYALCDKFWENIYPTIEGDDFDYRLSPIISLISRMSDMSLFLPITKPQDDVGTPRSLSDWIEARYNSKIANDANKEFVTLHESLESTEDMFLVTVDHHVQKIIKQIEQLDTFLNDKTHGESPSFSSLLTNLNDVAVILGNVISDRKLQRWDINQDKYVLNVPKQKEEAPSPHDDEEPVVGTESNQDEDPLSKATLDQAFAALYQISAFIEKRDPQSPVATLIKLALFLRNKTFTELMGMQTKDGEPVVMCISKLYNSLNDVQVQKFDKSIFDES